MVYQTGPSIFSKRTLLVAAFLRSDTFDDIGDSQSHSSLNEATAYLGCVKGKGKGIPMRKGGTHGYRPRVSHLSIEDRRRKLQEIKARSTCKKCGKKGHWAGDRECTAPTGTHQKSKGDRKKVGHLAVVESGLHDAACQTECSPSSSSNLGASPTQHKSTHQHFLCQTPHGGTMLLTWEFSTTSVAGRRINMMTFLTLHRTRNNVRSRRQHARRTT